ncbi:MAG: c-type cytochrome [Verrucomicrobiales bacterium]
MTGFAGLLNDEKVAAVIAYVRTSFGHNAPLVPAEKVQAVREAARDRLQFYMVDEILREHPLR